MGHEPGHLGKRRLRAALPDAALAGAGLLVLLGAVAFALSGQPGASGSDLTPSGADLPLSRGEPPTRGATQAARRPHRRLAAPIRISIPKLGVDAEIVRLGLNADGTLQVPTDFATAGWWTGGARPGERGPAVIAGHVDSRTGPAVFFRLGSLRRGDTIAVRRRDGHAARFAVDSVRRYAKTRFPTKAVYGLTRRPTLRLITCSGAFDQATAHYLDNTVVYATLISRR
jgi:sortase (surface protein transpeptidase)